MSELEWLADTRTSYDTVAVSYAEFVDGAFAAAPVMRSLLVAFADLVRGAGGGLVADVGCGPGQITAYLCGLGVDAFGIDLSPAMVDLARRRHPGLRFEVGSMTDLPLGEGSVAGLLVWYSLIHVPDDAVPPVIAHFHRALRPGGLLALGFHAGEESRLKTEGYGGHPMKVYVHRRTPERIAAWLRDAGFKVELQALLDPGEAAPGGVVFARR
ncbi:MAG TPA: class I SAM-dependent methyltransferase [Candidatus Limnocylindrales bacterium]